MGVINLLDFSVANLIAAGEVVDRPASVIKELLENSIDAGANDITIEIKRGGITFMRVTDNGHGIGKDDMPVAIKRHATSKIKDADDLDSIMTLGFRGEALAAIASVSRLRIMSKTPDSRAGYLLESEGGEVKALTEAGCADGTTVIVENLFENVPARLKFLKKDVTEAMAVSAYVEKIALSRPDIAFKLIIDGSIKFMTSGDNKLYNAIYILLGRDFVKRMIPVDNTVDGIRVYGYIGTPDNIRANRNFQNFFINRRFIKSKTVSAALEQSYSTFIPSEKFPCAVINIEINPSLVDVNVHPAKLEVKFSNERIIFDTVYATVRQALESKITRPEFELDRATAPAPSTSYVKPLQSFIPISNGEKETKEQLKFGNNSEAITAPKTDTSEKEAQSTPFEYGKNAIHEVYNPDTHTISTVEEIREHSNVQAVTSNTAQTTEYTKAPIVNAVQDKPIPEYRIIGEAFYSYVIIETENSVLIIDKHAAHERIIFEELKQGISKQSVISQVLLIPLEIALSGCELAAISEFKDELVASGFAFDVGDSKITVTEAPADLDDEAIIALIETIAERAASGTGNVRISKEIVYEKALFQASCKAAIKIGHIHDIEHIKWICDRVLALDIIKFCPHGRPVAFELTRHDFEKQFKRV